MSQLQSLIKQREDAESFIARKNVAVKLADNPEFKQLILKEFCVEECARHAQLSQDPSLKPENQLDSLRLAQAAGHLRRWLSVVVTMGNHAENQLPSIDQAISEMRQEGEV